MDMVERGARARDDIVAMREPTKAMKEAGFWDGNVALHTYRAMIDAALGETKSTTKGKLL